MIIEVRKTPPTVIVNGLQITTAPPVGHLLRAIGTPTRLETGPKPAPHGFRNNQLHVFDLLGLHVIEHHHTLRAEAIGVALAVDERQYKHTPRSAFAGNLLFDGTAMPLNATESGFLAASPWQFEQFLRGSWNCMFDGFYVGLNAIGPKLPSGRRSKRYVITEVSISWPHDPNGPPALGAEDNAQP